ncbi:MAG: Demethylmenaquinone methyltransferase [Candidatus Heimdallarchaeota archaeon LC_2]|nr:MAG: Demethylmenaquinone methyltransferase [Candidatus Heimdallarchaeota archaeon LC_2]
MAASDPKYVKMVREDFHILSKSYDLINNFMSLGVDRQFRYIAIKNLYPESEIQANLVTWLDLGTGTGHLANELHKQKQSVFVVGLDISDSMIRYSKEREIYKDGCMNFVLADVAKTPFRKRSFSGAFSGFVGRHFKDYPMTLSEHYRIIQSSGRLMMLEMGRRATPISFLVDLYVGKIMSTFGKLAAFVITKGNAPFRLLENTYNTFHSPDELVEYFDGAGFVTRYKLVLMGSIVVILAHHP